MANEIQELPKEKLDGRGLRRANKLGVALEDHFAQKLARSAATMARETGAAPQEIPVDAAPTLRIDQGVKEALRTAAQQEHRSIANMVEVLIWNCCGRNDISIPEQDAPTATKRTVVARRPRDR